MPNQVQWYSIFVRNNITGQWEKIAQVKTPGLTNLILGKVLQPLYGKDTSDNIRTAEGQINTLPPSFFI